MFSEQAGTVSETFLGPFGLCSLQAETSSGTLVQFLQQVVKEPFMELAGTFYRTFMELFKEL